MKKGTNNNTELTVVNNNVTTPTQDTKNKAIALRLQGETDNTIVDTQAVILASVGQLTEGTVVDADLHVGTDFFADSVKGLALLNDKIKDGKVIRLSSGKAFENVTVYVRDEVKKSTGKMAKAYVFVTGYGKKGGKIEQSYWLTCLLQYVKVVS